MNYWLMKSEPDEFSIDDLALKQCDMWDGVRNYQARNFLNDMNIGDLVFFYHSSCKEVGIAGVMKIIKAAYPDPTAEDSQHPYYDAKSSNQNRWSAVDVAFVERFNTVFTLKQIKFLAKQRPELQTLLLIQRNRLSVMPLSPEQWVCLLEEARR